VSAKITEIRVESSRQVAILSREKMMRVIIAGARTFDNYELLKETMAACGFIVDEVVSGCARGADTLGELWAVENCIPIKKFPADWSKYGNAAGPIRNEQMARYGNALVAFLAKDSIGTRDMIARAKKYGLPTIVMGI
jgi:hypothetical protein